VSDFHGTCSVQLLWQLGLAHLKSWILA